MDSLIGVGSISIVDVNDALITTDGNPPRNPSEGTLWIDDSGDTSVLKVFHNGTWEIQKLDVNNLDPDLAETIQVVLDTLGTIADDGQANFSERKRISQEVSSIIGELPSRKAGNVYPNTLPTHTTLDSRGVGSFASARENARNATIGTDESVYIELRQAYDALNSYLSAQTPKLWDITDTNKNNVAVLTDPDEFREVFLDYYMAELRLSTESEKRAQEAMKEYTDTAVADVIVSVDVEYSKNSSATSAPTSGWNTTPPSWENGKFIWSRTITNYKNGDTHITEPVNITGATGESGVGTDGRSISSIQEQYYLSDSATNLTGGSWQNTPPTWQDGKFMWTRSIITFANPEGEHTTDPVSVTGSRGEKGDKGDKGDNAPLVKLSGTTQIIKVDKDGNTTPSSSFTVLGSVVNTSISSWQYSVNGGSFSSSLPTGVSRSSSTVTINPSTSTFNTLSIRATDGTVTDTFTIARAVDGATGTPGSPGSAGADAYTVVLTNESHTFAGGTSNALAGSTTTDILAYKGTTRVPVTVEDVSGMPTGMTRTISNNGQSNARVTFTVSTSMTSASGTVTLSLTVDGQSIEKTFSYAITFRGTDGKDGEDGKDGTDGTDGKGIQDTSIDYQLSSSGTSEPTGSWSTSIPTPVKGQYLWVRTRTTYTDSSVVTTYNVSYFATDGQNGADGKGITNTEVRYQQTTSGTTTPTGTWSTSIPTPIKGRYLWTRTVITYTDGTSSTSYSTSYYATDGAPGADGKDGTDGKDGKGVVSTTVTYQNHTNGTTPPTGTWVSSPPTPVQGRYLWTRMVTTYTEGSPVTTYSVSYHATNGQDGSDGNGVSSTEVRYQISTSGTSVPTGTWSSSLPTPIKGRFLWTRTVITYTNGTSSTAYSTSYYATDGQKGDKGDPGANGVSVTSVDVEYYLSTSATALSGGSWVTNPPNWVDGRFMWTRTKTTYSTGNPTTTDPVSISGSRGSTGTTGSAGRSVSSLQEQYVLSTSKTTAPTSGWVTTPPTWQPGTYMWTRILVTYANPSGTSTTTPVIDTSWEAIDNLEIGGRNLVVRANEHKNTLVNVSGELSSGSGNDTMRDFIAVTPGDTLTFTKQENGDNWWRWRWLDVNEGYISRIADNRHKFQWVVPENAYYIQVSYPNNSYPKVERGNKATDWTEAPEDTDEKFEAIESNYSAYIEETSKAILSYVGETHLEKSEMEERVRAINTLIEQTSSSWQISFEDTINNLTNSLASEIEEAGEANKFIRMENGNIILGQQGSNTEIVIKQDRISFMDSGVEVAHITHQQMRIDQGIFLRSVQIGAHIIKSLDNSPNITVVEFVGQ